MIHPDAVKQYFAQEKDSHVWLKSIPEAEIDRQLALLEPAPLFTTPMGKHQKIGFLLGVAYLQFLFLYEMGTGKTLLMLELMRYLMRARFLRKAIVFVPADANVFGWEDEIKLWMPDMPYALLVGSSEEKWERFERQNNGLVIGTYQGISLMTSELTELIVKKKKIKKYIPDHKLISRMTLSVGALILDESTKVATHTSLWYQVADLISKRTKIHFALAGRAFGTDPMQLWPQFNLIDRGASLGTTLGMFREAFFTKKKNFWGGPFSFDYTFNKRYDEDLARMVGHRSLYYSADECVDLPERVNIIKRTHFSSDADTYYQRIVKQIIALRGNASAAKAPFIRMRQLCSGFMGVIDDESGDKAELEMKENPKLDMLLEYLGEVPDNRQFIIVHEFTWSGRKICEQLKKLKIGHEWLWGGEKDTQGVLDRFKRGEKQGLVVNWRKGAYGLNLQNANYVFVYESPVSAIDRDQLDRRVWRQGQRYKVFQYDLIVAESVEEKILKFLKSGDDLFKAVVDDPQILLAA